MAKKILITGGTGLVATHLTRRLIEKDYSVAHLSRNKDAKHKDVETFYWDI
ncbi:NAD-dependent epimerase/dehydratase family protein, partial [Pseudoxanthomonas sp. SGD-10]